MGRNWGLYGAAEPFLAGLLTPVVGGFLNLPTGKNLEGGFWLSFGDAVFDTLFFAYVCGVLGVYVGLVSGVLLAVGGWLVELANSGGNENIARFGPYVVSAAL